MYQNASQLYISSQCQSNARHKQTCSELIHDTFRVSSSALGSRRVRACRPETSAQTGTSRDAKTRAFRARHVLVTWASFAAPTHPCDSDTSRGSFSPRPQAFACRQLPAANSHGVAVFYSMFSGVFCSPFSGVFCSPFCSRFAPFPYSLHCVDTLQPRRWHWCVRDRHVPRGLTLMWGALRVVGCAAALWYYCTAISPAYFNWVKCSFSYPLLPSRPTHSPNYLHSLFHRNVPGKHGVLQYPHKQAAVRGHRGHPHPTLPGKAHQQGLLPALQGRR